MGGPHHLSGEYFKNVTGAQLLHVPYKGGGPAMTDLMGGQIPILFSSLGPSVGAVKGGKVRALGVTGAKRSPLFPDVPTIAEAALPDYEVTSWMGVLAPARTPRPVVNILNGALAQALAAADVRETWMKVGSEPLSSTPEELAKRMAAGVDWFAQVTKLAGIKPQ